ncbi:MAG: hypothetical protein KF808_03455 [Cryobacterium sp.]|nr:hypothetical protein [Cryobacterium sp.]
MVRKGPVGRFLAWRWWRGWRGWLVFFVVAAIVCTASGIWLAQTFSPAPEPWSKFPGVPQVSTDQVLKNQSIEQLESRVDEAMAEIRSALTREFGFEWRKVSEAAAVKESNRYHGESLLNVWDSDLWQSVGTLRTVADKQRAVSIVSEIMSRLGFGEPTLQNLPGPEGIADFGGFTLEDQGRWLLTGAPPEISRGSLNFTILDLDQDRTGMLHAQSEAAVSALGWEPEYLSIGFHGDFLLSEKDRAEFERRAEPYKGHIAPVPGRNKD